MAGLGTGQFTVRLHAVLPPIAAGGTCLSLRVLRPATQDLAALTRSGTIAPQAAAVIDDIIRARLALLISGGTGAGKTTLLSAVLGAVAADERIVCVEDAAELAPAHPHLVKLVARCANVEGVGEVTVRDLVRQALRIRPHRIVVGEVRGAEVVDLLAALNTGHDGGAGTVHANNPAEVPARLEALASLGGLDRAALHSQLAAAVQVVVHVSRDRSGTRRLSEIGLLRAGEDGRVRVATAWHANTGFGCGHEHLVTLLRNRFCHEWRVDRAGTGAGDDPGRLPTQAPNTRPSRARTPQVPFAAVRGRRRCGCGDRASCQRRGGLLDRRCHAVDAQQATGSLRRRTAESEALRGALDVLVGELRVGAHPVAAFSVAASEVDGAVAASLRAVAARARLGVDVAAGLRSVARSSSLSAHWERLAVCWQLAQDHGLAIATLMQTAQRDIVERGRFTAKVDAGMTGARTTAAVLAGLPLLGVGLGQLIGADPVTFLLSGGMGGWLLVIGVALACGGLLWSDHITAQVST